MTDLITLTDGNVGSLEFLMGLHQPENWPFAIPIIAKLKECPTIKGGNLYVLWSDLCGKDYKKVMNLCMKCPNDILQEACSRQDYSGRQLIQEYLKS